MGTALGIGTGLVGLLLLVLAVILGILWICLPFAVFGIRKKLDAMAVTELAISEAVRGLAHELKRANYIAMVAHGLHEQKDPDGTVRVLRP
jgi:hypothetical protein